MTSPETGLELKRNGGKRTALLWVLGSLSILLLVTYFIWNLMDRIQAPVDANTGLPEESTQLREVPLPGDPINVLLLGVDAVQKENGVTIAQRSDTMMLLHWDPAAERVSVISVPRDTLAEIPGRSSPEKVAHAYAYGGAELAMQAAEKLFGVPVPYYVQVDFNGFERLVDLLGGVEVEVKRRMYYHDPTQDLLINLHPGVQRLQGEDALGFVRYRQDGDLNRIERQQYFLKAAADQLFSVGGFLKLPQLALEATNHVRTNLEKSRMLSLATHAVKLTPDVVEMEALPTKPWWGPDGLAYEVPDAEKMDALIEKLIWGIDRERNAQTPITIEVYQGFADEALRLANELGQYDYPVTLAFRSGPLDGADGIEVISNEPDSLKTLDLVRHLEMRYADITLRTEDKTASTRQHRSSDDNQTAEAGRAEEQAETVLRIRGGDKISYAGSRQQSDF